MRVGVLLSGQGAQKQGMGRELYENGEAARQVFERLAELDPDIVRLCLDAEAEELNQTVNTQPAVFAMAMAAFAEFSRLGIEVSAFAGFSLGEYGALAASGMLTLEDTFRLVKKRAEWMQACAEAHPGGMAAVLGKNEEQILELIAATEEKDVLLPVNFNCPGQIVVAGDEKSLAGFLAVCKERRTRAVRLAVNGAFHSQLMEAASQNIRDYISTMEFKTPTAPVYANVTGKPYEGDVRDILARQTMSPVRFHETLSNMIGQSIDTFVEVGVGATLEGFIKRTSKEVRAMHVDSMETLAAVREELA